MTEPSGDEEVERRDDGDSDLEPPDWFKEQQAKRDKDAEDKK